MADQYPQTIDEIFRLISRSPAPEEQDKIRSLLRNHPNYYSLITAVYFHNPFFRLAKDELDFLSQELKPEILRGLVAARDAATRSKTPKLSVFCMPKSGSSFVQSALQHALQLPVASLTGFGVPLVHSHLGMNSREQELDELAVIKAAHAFRGGFISQNHTRYSPYLGHQITQFGIQPVVTVRNILDCIVSFDEMLLAWRKTTDCEPWISDPQFALPLDYPDLEDAQRYGLLGRSFGIWLLNFHLSWIRGIRQGIISPLYIRYEDDILDKDRFIERVSGHFKFSSDQVDRLDQYTRNPDRKRSRLNIGRRGRGEELVPQATKDFLIEHARCFHGELPEDEIRYLLH